MPFQLLFCLRGGTITHTYTRGASACDRVVGIARKIKKRGRRLRLSRLPSDSPRCLASCSSRRGADWEQRRVSRDTARFTKRRSACTKSVSRFPESLRRQQKLEDVSNRQRDAPLAAFDDVPCGRTCQLAVDERPGDHFDAVL
jgi:hypothetical protein